MDSAGPRACYARFAGESQVIEGHCARVEGLDSHAEHCFAF